MKQAILHKHYEAADLQVRQALLTLQPGRLMSICGLPGAGKSFLRNRVIRDVFGEPTKWVRGKVPAVEVMALLPSNSKFSSKGFAARAHRSVVVPDIRGFYRDADDAIAENYEIDLADAERAWSRAGSYARTSEADYWQSFMECARARGIKYICVEHADALCITRKDESPADHVQNLMSVLESLGAVGIFTHVPRGYKLWHGRPEISDRMVKVFIRPYDIKDKEQLAAFAALALAVADTYPFSSLDVVRKMIVEIAMATGTAVRPLEELFRRASSITLSDGAKGICERHLRQAMPCKTDVETIWRDVALLRKISQPAPAQIIREAYEACADIDIEL